VFLGPGDNRFPGNEFSGVAFGTLQGTVFSLQFVTGFIVVEIINILGPVYQFKFPAVVIGMAGTAILLLILMVSFSRINSFFQGGVTQDAAVRETFLPDFMTLDTIGSSFQIRMEF
jgi:hypothetical protein